MSTVSRACNPQCNALGRAARYENGVVMPSHVSVEGSRPPRTRQVWRIVGRAAGCEDASSAIFFDTKGDAEEFVDGTNHCDGSDHESFAGGLLCRATCNNPELSAPYVSTHVNFHGIGMRAKGEKV